MSILTEEEQKILHLEQLKAEALAKLEAIKDLVWQIDKILEDPPEDEIRPMTQEERLRAIERYRLNRINQ